MSLINNRNISDVANHLPLIFLVAGARPNFMKIAPIIRELSQYDKKIDYRLIHTGQHYSHEMSDIFFEELEIPLPDYCLEVGSDTHAQQTAKIMTSFENVCNKERPDLVVVVGDVNSTLACAIVAKKLQIKVAHIEAGLRSGDMAMPEEVNRIVTDSISDYFFVTEASGMSNLIAEGKPPENIFFVGNVMIDNLYHQVEKLKKKGETGSKSAQLKEKYKAYGVLTLHRPSNVDNKEILECIVSAIEEISKELPLIFPIHPRTNKNFEKFGIELPNTIVTTEPLSYSDFLNLFMDAKVVLTDSGGIQEETTALGVPCVTLRENTERPITITHGTNILVGTSRKIIVKETKKLLSNVVPQKQKPELWDGRAAKRIVRVMSEKYGEV